MLSKYYSCLDPDCTNKEVLDAALLETELKKRIPISDVKRISPGGTLGQFYSGVEGERKRFIKTHAPNTMAKENIEKEIYIMDFLYHDILHVSSFEILCGDAARNVLLMDFIEPCFSSWDITAIKTFLNELRIKAKELSLDKINYKQTEFCEVVEHSYTVLGKAGQIGKEIISYAEDALHNYTKYLAYGTGICHGDVSNQNLEKINDMYILFDWEDAMIGLPHYDFLYWLTFFSQRRYYGPSLFYDMGINERYGKDIMVMILMVKSFLSYQNGTDQQNRLSIQNRILEVMKM